MVCGASEADGFRDRSHSILRVQCKRAWKFAACCSTRQAYVGPTSLIWHSIPSSHDERISDHSGHNVVRGSLETQASEERQSISAWSVSQAADVFAPDVEARFLYFVTTQVLC